MITPYPEAEVRFYDADHSALEAHAEEVPVRAAISPAARFCDDVYPRTTCTEVRPKEIRLQPYGGRAGA